MTENVETFRVDTEKEIEEIKQGIELQTAAFQADAETASKLEAQAARITEEAQREKVRLTKQIARIEAVRAEVQAALSKRSGLKAYVVPKMPDLLGGGEEAEPSQKPEVIVPLLHADPLPDRVGPMPRKTQTLRPLRSGPKNLKSLSLK
jgi:hypothetical protein